MDEDDVLDISWLNDEEQFTNIERLEDKTVMNEIQVKIMYIDLNNTLIHTETEICNLKEYENEKSILPRDKLLLLIQSKKNRDNKKYRLSELLLYNVILEPENLQNYSKTTHQQNNSIYLKTLSTMIDDIQIPSSIVVFHTINTLYFIFQETTPSSRKTKKCNHPFLFTRKKR